jgi:MoaA/NifB/PqqE/SkfB family radical SAM enzyme
MDSSNLVNREQAILLKKKMKEIKKQAKHLRVHVNTTPIDCLTIDNLTQGTIRNNKCYYSRSTITVDPFGNVMGCFHFNNFLLGNLKTMPFYAIWRNKKHRLFLHAQKKGDIKICHNCISGVHRNPTFLQTLYRMTYFKILKKGFDEP